MNINAIKCKQILKWHILLGIQSLDCLENLRNILFWNIVADICGRSLSIWLIIIAGFVYSRKYYGKQCFGLPASSVYKSEDQYRQDEPGREILTWDDALRKSTQEFQHRTYSLFTCNCHSFVANNLNRLRFRTGGWNVVNLATLVFLESKWVSKASMVRSLLPFFIILTLGLAFGGLNFLTFMAFFTFSVVGWFLLGTYCFKDLIQL